MDFDCTIVSNRNGWEHIGFGKEMGEAKEKNTASSK